MRKIIILCTILLVAITAIAIKYFSEISSSSGNMEKVLKKIPQDAALILNFNNDETFYEIFKDYELFDAIVGDTRASEIQQLQEHLLKQPQLSNATLDKNIFVSFHPNKVDSVDFLYSINLNDKLNIKEIEELLFQIQDISTQKTNAENVYKLTLKTLSRPFYLHLESGAAIGSFSEELLTSCLDNNTPKLDKEFIEEINSSSRNQNSPVNLFINHSRIQSFISHFIRGKTDGNSSLLTNIKGLSSLNMNFKSDALMFNGISKPDTTSTSYLNLYLNQKPVQNDIKKILPSNTANFIAFGLSNYSLFKTDLNVYLSKKKELTKLQNQISAIKEKSGLDIDKELKPLIGNEFVIVETKNRQKIGIVKLLNGRKLNFSLQLLSRPVNETISQLNYSHIPYYFFGDPYKKFARPYYSIIDNYLIMANTPGVVQSFLNDYQDARFLIKTPQFAEYNQLLANQSNILYFINNENSDRIAKTVLKKKFYSAFTDENYGLKNFYGFSYQWSSDKEHFFTNIYINYISKGADELKEVWQLKLNGRLALTPQILQKGEEKFILVQDNVNNLYAISTDGKKLWSTQLPGKVLSSFQQLNDGSILFNTQNKLYRINIDGSALENFPINLPFNASYGICLSQLSPQEAKIFIPAGNVIMGFDLEGKPLPNWNKSLEGRILFDLKTASLNDVNYLIAGTEPGNFYFFNQSGNLINKVSGNSETLFKNPITIDLKSTLNDLKIITADTSGILTSISFNGNITRKKITDVDKDFFFEYKNILNDEQPEVIYLDRSGLNVFSWDGIPSFSYNLNKPITNRPLFFAHNNYKFQLGLADIENSELILFDEDGKLAKGFPAKGRGLFLVGNLKNDGQRYLLCTDKNNILYAYKL